MPGPGHVHRDAAKTEIPDEEELYRLIHPSNFPFDPKINRRRVGSGAFHTPELSCLRLKLCPISQAITAKPKHGVGVFTAGYAKSIGCIICIEDEDEFPANSHVVLFRNVSGLQLSDRQCKQLAKAADNDLRIKPTV